MGKKQHQKDKLYLTTTEWSTLYGGYRPAKPEDKEFRRLPFTHCAISLQPFDTPFCSRNGNVYDIMHIVPFVKKYKVDPVTGEAMELSSLVKLRFHKGNDGKYHCPVLVKVFTENSHIVAIRNTGNVMSYEAVEQLNIKPQNWKELLTDEAFTRKDIITIQDPQNLSKFNLSAFYHIKNNVRMVDDEKERALLDPTSRLKSVSAETKVILSQLKRDYKPSHKEEKVKKKADKYNAAHFSTGMVAAGLTSTVMEPVLEHEAAVVEEDTVRYRYVKKNGHVRLVTNAGPLNLELYCQQTPKTCENFIKHCLSGYYNGTKFHRSIRNFMIQGGDPTGTGEGGRSIWDKPFSNEIRPNFSHTGRGVLSMANNGPDSNRSQFFITFRSCKHLDGKHTVFGSLVGGMDTLNNIERVETDNKDRPIEDIVIERSQVFTDPYQEADEQLAKLRAEERLQADGDVTLNAAPKQTRKVLPKPLHSGVGKYLNLAAATDTAKQQPDSEPASKRKKTGVGYSFGAFSSW